MDARQGVYDEQSVHQPGKDHQERTEEQPTRRTDMTGICEGRIAIVTGAGRGLGREHALELARQGAKVVVNDLGTSGSGEGASSGPAQEVVDEILAMGGEAVANASDIADFQQAQQMVQLADRHVRRARRARQQRRLPPRPDARQRHRGRVGRGHPRAPQGSLRPAAACSGVLARRVEGRPHPPGTDHQHLVRRGAPGLDRAGRPTPPPRPGSPGSRWSPLPSSGGTASRSTPWRRPLGPG